MTSKKKKNSNALHNHHSHAVNVVNPESLTLNSIHHSLCSGIETISVGKWCRSCVLALNTDTR